MVELTQKLVKEMFQYEKGKLFWKKNPGNQIHTGSIAGTIKPDGYCRIEIDGKSYYLHRLIFLYHNGYLPKYIDHIDGNPRNNIVVNLREVTFSQNRMNSRKIKNTSSIYKGVNFHKRINKWQVRIGKAGERIHLGYYTTEEKAALAYNKAALELFGEYARLNEDI
jgi:hypothetical protein